MTRSWLVGLAAAIFAVVLFPAAATAQSGHFITGGAQAPSCTQVSPTQLQCTGKVAGLGGTTFEIRLDASGIANITCSNPGRNEDVPGQRQRIDATGTSGPLPTPRNGRYVFTVTTATPTAPAGSCPNPRWTATVASVEFDEATLLLFEDGVLVDSFRVF